jgi:hypothetical protein
VITIEELARRTSLGVDDIRRMLLLVTGMHELNDSVILLVLVFDIMVQLGFEKDQVMSMLCEFEAPLLELGDQYAASKTCDMVKAATMQILDNRYVTLPRMTDIVYDLRAAAAVAQIPTPCLSLALVLPQLYRRALSAPVKL